MTRVAKTRGKNLRRSPFREKASDAVVHAEPLVLARMIRGARAVLGWSQTELASRAGLSQLSILRIEQGTSDVKHSTVVTLEKLFMTEGIAFETAGEAGFKIVVSTD